MRKANQQQNGANNVIVNMGGGPNYVRQQKGHSIIIWLILSCMGIGIPFLIYYTFSPNHYWHA